MKITVDFTFEVFQKLMNEALSNSYTESELISIYNEIKNRADDAEQETIKINPFRIAADFIPVRKHGDLMRIPEIPFDIRVEAIEEANTTGRLKSGCERICEYEHAYRLIKGESCRDLILVSVED